MVPPKSDKSIFLWPRSPHFDEESLIFACSFSSTEFTASRPDAAAFLKGKTVTFFSQLTFLPMAAWGHFSNGASNILGCRESNLKGTTQVQCFQKDTYLSSCCRKGTSRVLPGCLSPHGIAALLKLLTLSQMDQEAARLKIKCLFSSLSNHDIAAQSLSFFV